MPARAPTIEEVVAEQTTFIRSVLRRFGVRPDDTDDVMQIVLLAIHRRLEVFDPEPSADPKKAIRGLLFRICERCAAEHRRKGARRREVLVETGGAEATAEHESPTPDAEAQMIAGERKRLVLALLVALPADRRAVVTAYDLDGDEMGDIAAQVGIPPNTAWTRRHLGFRDLRAAWRRQRGREK